MAEFTPFTYLIGWTFHDKWYYGVRYSKNCHPMDLWKTYFTSSKKVKHFREFFGEPDIIEVRKTFNNAVSALNYEQDVLKRLKIKSNDKWLNQGIGKPTFNNRKHTEETIQKMKKTKPEGFGEKIRQLHTGKKRSDHTKLNISLSKKGLALRSKKWLFECDGEQVEIFNLHKYCRDNHLNVSCMQDVYRGKQIQHKNFRKAIQ